MSDRSGSAPLAILAGSGALPLAIAEAAQAKGRDVFILALPGADPGVTAYPHILLRWGQIGRLLAALRRHHCRDLVIIGGVRRPNLWSLRIDLATVRHLITIKRLTRGGDDSVLGAVVRFFEREGFRVLGAHEIAESLLAPAGALGRIAPDADDMADIARALAIIRALGQFDIGQGAVVARGHTLAVEAAEGTDAMLRRSAGLRQWGLKRRSGVLVKAPKPGQDLRVDMPTIGPRTIALAAEAGLKGVAVTSGDVLLAEVPELVRTADAAGLFVFGVAREPQPEAEGLTVDLPGEPLASPNSGDKLSSKE